MEKLYHASELLPAEHCGYTAREAFDAARNGSFTDAPGRRFDLRDDDWYFMGTVHFEGEAFPHFQFSEWSNFRPFPVLAFAPITAAIVRANQEARIEAITVAEENDPTGVLAIDAGDFIEDAIHRIEVAADREAARARTHHTKNRR